MEIFPLKKVIRKLFRPPKLGARSPPMGAQVSSENN